MTQESGAENKERKTNKKVFKSFVVAFLLFHLHKNVVAIFSVLGIFLHH